MAADSFLDDESDYGISAEEETLLSQLLSDLPTPPSGDKLPLVDSVAIVARLAVTNDASTPTEFGDKAGASPSIFLPHPGTLPTELPRGDEIAHLPDCTPAPSPHASMDR